MRKSKFSEAQIVAVLQEAEAGMPVAERLRKHGISRPTYFAWKSKYAGPSYMKRHPLVNLDEQTTQGSALRVSGGAGRVRRLTAFLECAPEP